jgi:hypothetical protein
VEERSNGCCSTGFLKGGDGGGLADARHPRKPFEGCGGDTSRWRRPQIERPHRVEPIEVAVEFGRHAFRGDGPQRVQGGERGRVAGVEQPGDAHALVLAQAGDQMAPEPGARTIADSPDQSLDDRDAGQKHLVGDQPCRRSIDQGAGPVVTTPAQGIEPSGQTEPCHGIVAEVGEAAVRPDESQVPNTPASLEIGIHARRGLEGELLDHRRQDRRGDLGGRHGKCPQKSGARQHHREAEPIVVATQRSDEIVIGSVQMEVPGELVGRRLAIEAGKAPTLGIVEVTGGHDVQNFQHLRRGRMVPRSMANSFAKHMCEIASFCSEFRTVVEVTA